MVTKHPISFLVALIMALTLNMRQVKAQTFVEVQTNSAHPYKRLTFLANLSHQFNDRWGLSIFFLTTSGYAQAYAGPTRTFKFSGGRVLALNISFGGEQSPKGFTPRYAGSMLLRRGKLSFLGITEADNEVLKGDDTGLFYDLSFKLSLGKFAIGLKDKRPSGLGPMIQGKVGRLTAWVAWLPFTSESFELQPDMVLVGVRFGS